MAVSALGDLEEEELEDAIAALQAYRAAAADAYGPLRPLEPMLEGLDELNTARRAWVDSGLKIWIAGIAILEGRYWILFGPPRWCVHTSGG